MSRAATALPALAAAAPPRLGLAQRAAGLRGLALPVALLLGAQIWAMAAHLQSDSIASPVDTLLAGAAAVADGSLFVASWNTLVAMFGGLALGCAIGLVCGILLGSVRLFDRLMEFTIEALRPIPSVALIPVALLVYGFGYRMEIAVVAFSSVWPMLILTRGAILAVEPRLLEVARALRFGLLARTIKIVLPAALPRIFVAFRLSVGVALIVAVTVEITANPLGLGYGMMMAEQSLHPALMLAFLAWIGVIGWGLNLLLLHAQARLFGRAAMAEAPR